VTEPPALSQDSPTMEEVYASFAGEGEPGVQAEDFFEAVKSSPAAEPTLVALSRLIESLDEKMPGWREWACRPDALQMIFAIAGQSAYFSELCVADPGYLKWLIEKGELHRFSSRGTFSGLLGAELGEDIGRLSEEDFLRTVRVFRRREMLRIGMRDILDIAPIESISAELSSLADVLIGRCLHRATVEIAGPGSEPPLAVIGMGKLGGQELNFSSDVDLVFVAQEEGGNPDGAPSHLANRIASRLIGLLAEPTEDGYVFRVDVRLRPQGGGGPLVHTVSAAQEYYGTWGQPWERQALLKARHVAGDVELGERFIQAVEPFTYRRHVDPIEVEETLGAIRRVRQRYHAPRGDGRTTRDVKIGRGGIREVEFIVQAIQMLYGGSYPEIRHPNTFEALRRIHQSGLLSAADYQVLYGGYSFMRRIEHRIQMEREFHSFVLPQHPGEMDRLGRKLGYADGEALLGDYHEHSHAVAEIYDAIFTRETSAEDLNLLLSPPERDDAGVDLLGGMGFAEPARVRETLYMLSQDPEAAHLSSKIQRLFREVLPRLLADVSASPEPDRALRNLEEILTHYGAKTQFYSVLAQHPPVLELFVTLGACSQHLCNLLTQEPALVELLLTPAVISAEVSDQVLQGILDDALAAFPDRSFLDHLRALQRSQSVVIGSRYLLRLTPLEETVGSLTCLAEFVLRNVVDYVGQSHVRRFGEPVDEYEDPVPFAALGMGKLGGRELNFTSDLDLIFVHGGVEDDTGDGDLSVPEYFARWAQAAIQAFEETTPYGQLYQIDCRLRPHGRSAPLVVSVSALEKYLKEEGALWERQAWTRARVVWGGEVLGPELETIQEEFVYGKGISAEDKQEIQRVRGRVNKERQAGQLKAGRGGIVDVEFLVQALLLEHGREKPRIREQNTFAAIEGLRDVGILPRAQASALLESYRHFRDIENRLQIMENLSVEDFPSDPDLLASFVKRLYYRSGEDAPTPDAWIREYQTRRQEVARLVDDYFRASKR
jgi:glutamate-ammonia-ligase adenylyltransferase